MQLLEGLPFLLSCQEVLDHVLQSSVKVEGQRIAIHLHVLAGPQMYTVFGHRRSLLEVIEGRHGIPLEIPVSEQGSQRIGQRVEGGQLSWGRPFGIKEISVNQWPGPATWGSIQKEHGPDNLLALSGELGGLAGNPQAECHNASF